MKIRIYIDKIHALRAGKEVYGFKAVEVPIESLAESQRQVLIKNYALRASSTLESPGADWYMDHRSAYPFTEATKEQVLAALEKDAKEYEEEEAKKKAEREKEVQKWLDATFGEWTYIRSNYVEVRERGDRGSHQIPFDSRLDKKYAEVQKYAESET